MHSPHDPSTQKYGLSTQCYGIPNCIARVHEQRGRVRSSLYPEHHIFKPLFFDGKLEVEEFEPEKP